MRTAIRLVSHHLCPYVQRAVIIAAEKGIDLERTTIDLSDKPVWFTALSPTGKVPLLQVTDSEGVEQVLFESAAICEYLDETSGSPLMPTEPIARARQRAWVEFASGTLSEIAALYTASDDTGFGTRRDALRARFAQVDAVVGGPWFSDERFGMVDAAFGPVFRYVDAFEAFADVSLADHVPKVTAWRAALASRPSVAGAVATDYSDRLRAFLLARGSHLTRLMEAENSLP